MWATGWALGGGEKERGCGELTKLGVAGPTAVWHNDGRSVSAPAFLQMPGVVQASTTRNFQASLSTDISRVQEIRAACDMLGLHETPFFLGEQKHTCNVAVAKAELCGLNAQHHVFPATDALVSSTPGMALVIQTADCAPIFLYDPESRVIGLAHAGWKGTLARIAESTVAEMVTLGAVAERIVAWIGPMAGACCYEVSEELIERFVSEFGEMPAHEVHEGKQLNLPQINASQLRRAGVSPDYLQAGDACTIHQHEHFFSYRASKGTTGRILSILAMTEN